MTQPGPPADDPLTDEELFIGIVRREVAALEALYARYHRPVYALSLRLVGSAETAEELLHEVFWRVWQRAGDFDGAQSRPATWLLAIAHHLAVDERRRRSRRPDLATGSTGEFADRVQRLAAPDDVAGEVWADERRRRVLAALTHLPDEQRQAVCLAYYDGLSQREIAAVQGAPLSTVKTRLALGLKKLSAALPLHGIYPEDARQ